MRLCGAAGLRDAHDRARCWCGGLFCGPGGFEHTKRFRAVFHTPLTANTRGDFEDLMRQVNLFGGDALRTEWLARLDAHRPTRARHAS